MMNNLNINTWKEFKVGDIFPKRKIKKFSSEPDSEGNIEFVSSSSINNGVSSLIEEQSIGKNVITVSTNGACFDCFYHDDYIAVSSDVDVLFNKNLNKWNALFICTVLKLEKKKYSYGRKPKNNKVFDTIIKLPSDKDGNPDWEFMENYIKSLWGGLHQTEIKKQNVELNTEAWSNFNLYNLFDDVYKGTALIKNDIEYKEDRFPGSINFISRTELNNGCDCYVEDNFDEDVVEDGNCLIIGDTTSTCFYQEHKFVTGDHIIILRASWMNKYNALFIKTILEKDRYKYNYGRAFKLELIKKTIIKLPSTQDGKPDWEYMENYIKKLMFSDLI